MKLTPNRMTGFDIFSTRNGYYFDEELNIFNIKISFTPIPTKILGKLLKTNCLKRC